MSEKPQVFSAGAGEAPRQTLRGGTYAIPWGHPCHWPLIPDGRCGRMRTQKAQRIVAANDRDALQAWFADKGVQPETSRDVYQRHVRRLLLWATVERQLALSDLTTADLLDFLTFLGQPAPAERWITPDHRTYALDDQRWRPFAGPLSPTTCRQACSVFNDLFTFLVDVRYLTINPMPTGGELDDPGQSGARRRA